MKRWIHDAIWVSKVLCLLFLFGIASSNVSFACHKYISKKTGEKGCSAWRYDKKSAANRSRISKSSQVSDIKQKNSRSKNDTTASFDVRLDHNDGNRGPLQWNGEWIGGSPSAATQLATMAVGAPYGASSGKSAVALRIKVRKSGTLVGLSVLVRMNRPWTSEGRSRYSGYSLGNGGNVIIEVRKIKNRYHSSPDKWVPDMTKTGLLAVTEINGQKSIKSVGEKYLEQYIKYNRKRTIPMWEWKLKKPLRVKTGDEIALVIRHVGSGNVKTRFTINSNSLYGSPPWKSKPFGKNGPVYGDFETVLYSKDRRKWISRKSPWGWHPVYALVYSDGDVRGWTFEVGNSSCRDMIGGKKWARMKMIIPNYYPSITLNEILLAAFRERINVGNLIVEIRDGRMRLINSVSIPASAFSIGIPKKSERIGTRYWTSQAFPRTRIGPGTYYVVLRSDSSNSYWLQGFSDNSPYLARNMVSKVRPRFIDALDTNGINYKIEKSMNRGKSWGRWKGYCEVFPILFRTR